MLQEEAGEAPPAVKDRRGEEGPENHTGPLQIQCITLHS